MYTQEKIISFLKTLEISDIEAFIDKRVMFKLTVKPCKKKTIYKIEATVNITSYCEDKDLIDYLSNVITNSIYLNVSFLSDKHDTDKPKIIYFHYCKYENILSNFTGEITNWEYNILMNHLDRVRAFVKNINSSLLDSNTNNNVIYLNR